MDVFNKNDIILFQGDSITDALRDRETDGYMGRGYPMMIRAWYSCNFPEKNVRFMNRGLSGNRARDLQERLKKDFIDLKPSWISILIGINDCWQRYEANDPTPEEEFEDRYRDLLTKLKQDTAARIVLCEPFLLPVTPDKTQWREDLNPKINVVRKIAKEFDTLLVPLDSVFANAAKRFSMDFWSEDGIHPTAAGHALIAREWLKTVGILKA